MHYDKPRENTSDTPVFDQAIDELIRNYGPAENRKYEEISLALRFPEYDSMIKNCHLTLKYWNKVTWATLLKHYINYNKMMPTQLHMPEWHKWVSNSDGLSYEGLYFVAKDHRPLLDNTRMPHITAPKNRHRLTANEKKFLLNDAEFIASEVYFDNGNGYVTLLELLTDGENVQ